MYMYILTPLYAAFLNQTILGNAAGDTTVFTLRSVMSNSPEIPALKCTIENKGLSRTQYATILSRTASFRQV